MPYKLTVSDDIEFDFRFTLNDAGEPREFGARIRARRTPQRDIGEALKGTVAEFIEGRDMRMQAWIGKAALVSDDGAEAPAGPEALAALLDIVSGAGPTLLQAYLEANGAKGRAGN